MRRRSAAGTPAFDPHALAAEFGTPLYVYDFDAIESRVRLLRESLPPRVDIAYAVKANPALAVVAHVVGLGLGVDVASAGELATVCAAGASPGWIVFTGPGKSDDELAAAVDGRVRAITVESVGELARLERVAAARGVRAPILLRVATSATAEGRAIIGGPAARKFGMRVSDVREAARRAVRSPHLTVLGVHAFGASNVTDADALADHVERTVSFGRELASRTGFVLRLVDVGGGLGIAYQDGEPELDVRRLGDRLAEIDRALAGDPAVDGTTVLLEPGRFLVGPAGWYVTRVVDVKRSGRRHVAVLDGGIHHLVAPALVGRRHRLALYPAAVPPRAGDARRVLVAGPLCTGLDVLEPDALIASPSPGDLIALADVGAYGFTESMPLFLSRPTPAEVALVGGHAQLIRRRIEPAALLEGQCLVTRRGLPRPTAAREMDAEAAFIARRSRPAPPAA